MPAWFAAPWVIPPAVAAFGKAVAFVGSAMGVAYVANEGINAMTSDEAGAGADAQAQEQLETDTSAANCATGNCSPRCQELYAAIAALTQELAERRAAMLADRAVTEGGLGMYDLFLRDPSAKVPDPRGIRPNLGNWVGHGMQITEKQAAIKNLMAQYKAEGCHPLPPGAETQANLPIPPAPFGR